MTQGLEVSIPILADLSFGSSSSEEADSTLEDNSGMSAYVFVPEFWRFGVRMGGVTGFNVEVVDFFVPTAAPIRLSSQQNVSRFHSLQLRFSSRRPFSSDSAHFENTFEEKKCQLGWTV